MINAKNGGTDIGSLEHVLANYNFQSRSNANTVIASIEFVKNCYNEIGNLIEYRKISLEKIIIESIQLNVSEKF